MKYHPHGSVIFCTFSIEEGLLLLCNPLCESIIKSCLARAQELHPVKLCHITVEATHVHTVLVVVNPDDVHGFIRCFKTESAHMINGLLGRQKRTVWCEGYDSPIVLTPTRALVAISYLYSNPAKDDLEISIDRYPGFSSWRMFLSGQTVRSWKRLRRPQFQQIPPYANTPRGYLKLAEHILMDSKEFQIFTLEPNAWLDAFGIHSAEEQERVNKRIVSRVRLLEERAEKKRVRKGRAVIGSARLKSQVFNTAYRPQRTGRRMWCLSEKRSVRMKFIAFFRKLMREARDIRRRWKTGEVTATYPAGLYPPSMPKLANSVSF